MTNLVLKGGPRTNGTGALFCDYYFYPLILFIIFAYIIIKRKLNKKVMENEFTTLGDERQALLLEGIAERTMRILNSFRTPGIPPEEEEPIYSSVDIRSVSFTGEYEGLPAIQPGMAKGILKQRALESLKETGKVLLYCCKDNGLVGVENLTKEEMENGDHDIYEKIIISVPGINFRDFASIGWD